MFFQNVPDYGCSRRFCVFMLSETLSLCMDYMIASGELSSEFFVRNPLFINLILYLLSDVLLDSQKASTAATCGASTATSAVLLANFAYFASRIVDCVWSGEFQELSMNVLFLDSFPNHKFI